MRSFSSHDEQKQNEQILLNDQNWDSEDDEDDSDYTPDQDNADHNELDAESVTSEDEDDSSGNSPETPVDTPTCLLSKRKSTADEEEYTTKRTKIHDQEEVERKARVEAIWAEMNLKDEDKKKPIIQQQTEKQPLDDISSSVNRTSIPPTEVKSRSPNSTATTITNTNNTSTTTTGATKRSAPSTRKKIVRPKSTLSALVSQYNIKVPKMNTLEKSRLDWQGYVDREGIRDDLKYTNKDGYMEKVAFLNRVDDRRLTQLKTGQKATRR
ncbi:hypothetical protein INT45_012403 [Circinella minor]|uniref:SWR1-complex protein 5 n=1 Tax=Circinella minor TaxID=1195481 RepID=A0A8H7S1W5_9FUNG|nr:hypothetical protein INT45_012403 [Circinella minor]